MHDVTSRTVNTFNTLSNLYLWDEMRTPHRYRYPEVETELVNFNNWKTVRARSTKLCHKDDLCTTHNQNLILVR